MSPRSRVYYFQGETEQVNYLLLLLFREWRSVTLIVLESHNRAFRVHLGNGRPSGPVPEGRVSQAYRPRRWHTGRIWTRLAVAAARLMIPGGVNFT